MKILYGITKSNFGGAQRYVFDLAVETKRLGHDVAVLCGGDGPLVQKLKAKNIKVILLNRLERDIFIGKEIASFFQILKVLKKERPDIFHINSSKMGGLGGLAGRLNGAKKIIFTSHGWAFSELRPGWQKVLIKFFVWLTILLSHKVICVSEKTREQVSRWPFVKSKLVVIYNGIDKFEIAPRTRTKFTVGTIGELHKIKGHDVLLKAWQKFVRNRDAKLVIIGDGEEKQNLKNMAKNMNIYGSVIFEGAMDDARSLLSNFDIFVFPSRSENLPYAILEAGLAGLPVIASAVGGIPEIIETGANGILVPKEDPEILFSSLILLAEDENLRKRLGTNLKSSIQENFSFEKMAEKTLRLYL